MKEKRYRTPGEQKEMAHEPIPQYGHQPMAMSHIHMSFGVDIPKDEDPEMLQLRIIAFAEYLSTRHNTSTKDKVIRQLNKLLLLDDNWDGYGSPQIDPLAAYNAKKIIEKFNSSMLQILRVTPTETGSISLRLIRKENESIGINCCKDSMSYFIEKDACNPEFYPEVPYTPENINELLGRIEQW
ncbi:MAG: hypothetical protein KBT34_11050 [Prevotella sp.]|nr:hypothetical protein [Candidatus Prevotella equi]